MSKKMKVRDIAGLTAHCNVAVVDNGNGRQLLSGKPEAVLSSVYADAVYECITVNACAIFLWLHHDEVVRVTSGAKESNREEATGKRKYFRKCGVCGERHEQSEMHRTEQSPNGWLCAHCLARIHPEYGIEQF
ncbi:hypothetical protein [Flavonifractor sp. An306]|uniref:hypothetical protein n=1 Tax=Flavonifractor sp. An306 TaxID=1965629 RepID=UPI00174D3D23|nr:hypothetical protein [Flavonifractor sp. An306]